MKHQPKSTMSKGRYSRMHEMMQYRERLIKQKEFLVDILSKIEKQILALQVERLHLRNTLLGSEHSNQEILPDTPAMKNRVNIESVKSAHDQQCPTEQQLDLSVPLSLNNYEEETEDEEDVKEILKQFDTLI